VSPSFIIEQILEKRLNLGTQPVAETLYARTIIFVKTKTKLALCQTQIVLLVTKRSFDTQYIVKQETSFRHVIYYSSTYLDNGASYIA